MAAPRKAREALSKSGGTIRDARDELQMTGQEFADLGRYSADHIRGLETQGKRCSQTFIDTYRSVAETVKREEVKAVLTDMVTELQKIRDCETAAIDRRRGVEGKRRKRARIGADARPLGGQWTGIWQTSRENKHAAVIETVTIQAPKPRQLEMMNLSDSRWLDLPGGSDNGAAPEPRHFRWKARCEINIENWIWGRFESLSSVRAAGLVWLKVDNFQEVIAGNWMGISADSEQTYGILVLHRSEELALRRFEVERNAHPGLPVTPIRSGTPISH